MAAAPERQLTDQGKERKQQILDAAALLFAERGYGMTRIADICDAAGVAKGLFYWYFENKETLFAELVNSIRHELRIAQAEAMAQTDDPVERLRRAVIAAVEFMGARHAYFSFVENEKDDKAVTSVLRDSTRYYLDDAAVLVRSMQAAGRLPADADVELLAVGILGSVATFTGFHRAGRVDIPVDELGVFVADFIVRGLGAT